MFAKIIIGYFALAGFVNIMVRIMIRAFPKSKATKFIVRNLVAKYDIETFERIE